MHVQDFLELSAVQAAEKVALVHRERRLTYQELDALSSRLAAALLDHGLGRGERVAVQLPNSVEAVVAIFAILKAGGVFVLIHATARREKLEVILRHCRASVLFVDRLVAGAAPLDATVVPSLRWTIARRSNPESGESRGAALLDFDTLIAGTALRPLPRGTIDLDLACLIYTSGSTGEPKGVMCDHASMVFVTTTIAAYLHNVDRDIILSVLPLAFSYGLYQLFTAFHVGATLVLEDSFVFPAVVLKRMMQEGVTGFAGVPTIYSILLSMDLGPFEFSRLRYWTNAAAALPVEHVKRLRARFPGVALYLMHGLTEVARTTYLDPSEVERRPDSVGRAIPGTEIWLEDDSGRCVAPGEVGEMVVRGRHVMRGYWDDPEATAARFRPGPIAGERVCHTGDLFRQDRDGFLYFVSRKDDIIKCRGEKVAPRAVENVLYALEGVTEAAVVGVPDPVLGTAIKAFVVAVDVPLTEAQVLAHCKAHLEDFMVPKWVEFRRELPKTDSGKIRKVELR